MIVADSSVLIHLAAIGRLELLRSLFGLLTLPSAVWQEVVEEGGGRSGAQEIAAGRQEGWIEVRQPSNELLLRSLKRQLDNGEAEAICLAVEHRASLILLDESEARQVAAGFDLERTGVIGVLMRSKQEGGSPSFAPNWTDSALLASGSSPASIVARLPPWAKRRPPTPDPSRSP